MPRTPPTTSYTPRTPPTSSYSTRTKPTSSYNARTLPTTDYEKRYAPWENCMAVIQTGLWDDSQVWEDLKIWWDDGLIGTAYAVRNLITTTYV